MDFGWSKTQQEIYERAALLGRERLSRSSSTFLREDWDRCGEFGLLGLCVPEAYGGLGLDAVTTARTIEGLARGADDMGLVFSVCAHLFAVVMPIVESGSEAQKLRFVPKLASGEWVGANAITEGDSGSDAFSLKTHAARDGDDYLLTGAKSYTTNGPIGDVFLTYATVNPQWGYMGVTAFIVERGAPGLTLGPAFGKVGLASSPAGAVYFDQCRVPGDSRIGDEGQGGEIFRRSMQWERACLFALYVGMMDRQLEQVIGYANERKQFGRSIGKNQAIAHKIADMKLRLESARLLLYRACWEMDQGRPAVLEVSLSKLAISEAAIQSGLDAIQIHGGVGVATDFPIERMLRDALPSTIFSGTSQMQRELIARELGIE